jgi:hypothetical protein
MCMRVQSVHEHGSWLTRMVLIAINGAASHADESTGTASLRRIAATTECSGTSLLGLWGSDRPAVALMAGEFCGVAMAGLFRAWRDAVVHLCVALFAIEKGWPAAVEHWRVCDRGVCAIQLKLMQQVADHLFSKYYGDQSRFTGAPLSFDLPDVSDTHSQGALDEAQDADDDGDGGCDRERRHLRLPSVSDGDSGTALGRDRPRDEYSRSLATPDGDDFAAPVTGEHSIQRSDSGRASRSADSSAIGPASSDVEDDHDDGLRSRAQKRLRTVQSFA